jgi:pectate lyase
VPSNTSLIGVGKNAAIRGGGLQLRKVHNIIVCNLAISEAGDAIDVDESHHVWIDHCDLSRCRDGLLDIKRGSDFITVSWNHFHDHGKTCLLGHSDKDSIRDLDRGHLRVTYHHNYFDGTRTRHPRVRFAEGVHVFNNYFRGNEYGVASVMDAGVIVEGNVFEHVERPTLTAYGDSPDPGRLIERHNLFIRSGPPETRGIVDASVLGYAYIPDPADGIAARVQSQAGLLQK